MASGVNYEFYDVNTNRVLTPEENVEIQNATSRLFCVGYVSYYDAARRMRITGFCRVLTFEGTLLVQKDNARFREFSDPNYEYQD